MKLGAFSISLNVKDINASKAFYENLGFTQYAGDLERKYLIMKNGDTIIGLFQGMFEKNILTFNPGWDQAAGKMDEYTDIRDIQKHLIKQDVKLDSQADESTSGPANFIVIDPDGNPVMFEQHV